MGERADNMGEDVHASILAHDEEEWDTLLRNAIPMPTTTRTGSECVEFTIPLHTAPEYSMWYRYELTWGVRKHGRRNNEVAPRRGGRTQTNGGEHTRDVVSCIEFEDPFMFVPDRSYFYRYELRQGIRHTWETSC